jgi:hypothetical protein
MGGLGGMIQVGIDILSSSISDKTKRILLATGNAIGQVAGSDNVEQWQHNGFASRPPKAQPGKAAAQAVVIRRGSNDVSVAEQDERGLELKGAMADGETAVYAAGEFGDGQARTLYKADGSVTHYTRQGNSPSGTGMMIQLNAQTGGINMVDAFGNGLTSGPDGWVMTSGGAGLKLTKSGDIHLVGKGTAQVDGKSIVLGSTVVPIANAALTGPTGVSGKASLKVLIE